MHLETENARLVSELQKRAKHCEEMERAIQNAESRDRQLNLQLVGLKEREGENLRELTKQLINDALGVKLADNELQRVYRPGPPVTDKDSPPRPAVIRFQSLLEREIQKQDTAGMGRIQDLILPRHDKSRCSEEEEIN